MENPSGIEPLLDRVLVLPDEIEEVTEGGIVIPDQVQHSHQLAQATGTLVAIGKGAYIKAEETVVNSEGKVVEKRTLAYPEDSRPSVGDRVAFARYGGIDCIGEDGKKYRYLNDKDITGRVAQDVKYTGIQSRKPITGE